MDHFPLSNRYENEEKFLSALPDADKLQEAIFRSTGLCIISTSTDGTITSFNGQAEALSGYQAEETINKISIIQFFDEEELHLRSRELTRELLRDVKPGFDTLTIKCQQTKTAEQHEWTFIKKDGLLLTVLLSVAPMWDANNYLIGYA
jgi:PAS domain-containing protein